jgi:hypothetical protein
MRRPTVYYSHTIASHYIANVPGEGFVMVPLRPDGWKDRTRYRGATTGLRVAGHAEAAYQLRSSGWEVLP